MKRTALTLILLLTACADGTTDEETFGEETTTGTDVSTSSDDGSGTGSSSEVSGTTGDGDGGDGDDNSSSTDTSGDGDGDSGIGDGDSVGGDGDGEGDGDGDGEAGAGEEKFPGDACDPFIDWCIDGYGCDPMDVGVFPPAEFRCRDQLAVTGQDMQYGSLCISSTNCAEGLLCISAQDFPAGDCDVNAGTKCCMDMCIYEETCANGNTCQVTWWQADLEDYLDIYTGIGDCASP